MLTQGTADSKTLILAADSKALLLAANWKILVLAVGSRALVFSVNSIVLLLNGSTFSLSPDDSRGPQRGVVLKPSSSLLALPKSW